MAAPDNPSSETKAGFPPPATDSQSGGYQPSNISDILKKRHAETASKLAVSLLVLLGGSVVAQYVSLMLLILYKRDDGAKLLEDLFHSWLPVLAGLAGSAVTYYFTRDRK